MNEPVYEDIILLPLGQKPPCSIYKKRQITPSKPGFVAYFIPSMCKMYDKDMNPVPLPKNWRKNPRILKP